MKFDADFGVVGGGPSGLAAAIEAARRGYDVAVFEPRESPIDKACGEGLMPGALAELDALGVQRPRGIRFVGVSYLDAYDPDLAAHGAFSAGHGLGVRRTTLHEALTRRLQEFGAEQIATRVEGLELLDDGVVLSTGHRVRWLIGADGLHSMVRRQTGLQSRRRGGSRYGVRRHYSVAPWSNRVEVYWGRRGEAYVTPVDRQMVGVAILFEPPGRFDELLDEFPALAVRLEGATIASDDRGAGPFGRRALAPSKGRALLVGDAAGYVDALTGEGIALGIASARAAVAAIDAGHPDTYPVRYRHVTRKWAWSTRLLLTMTRPRAVHRPLIRFLRAFPRGFDAALRVLA